jgi:hypothetical protein
MSASGVKRRNTRFEPTFSALPPEADIRCAGEHVRFGPRSHSMTASAGANSQQFGTFTASYRTRLTFEETGVTRVLLIGEYLTSGEPGNPRKTPRGDCQLGISLKSVSNVLRHPKSTSGRRMLHKSAPAQERRQAQSTVHSTSLRLSRRADVLDMRGRLRQ